MQDFFTLLQNWFIIILGTVIICYSINSCVTCNQYMNFKKTYYVFIHIYIYKYILKSVEEYTHCIDRSYSVYRSTELPTSSGHYLFLTYCSAKSWRFNTFFVRLCPVYVAFRSWNIRKQDLPASYNLNFGKLAWEGILWWTSIWGRWEVIDQLIFLLLLFKLKM